MTKKDFDKYLEQKQKAHKGVIGIDWESKKNEWLENLEKLYKLIQDSMEEYIQKGLVEIDYDNIELIEELIGTYKARRMIIKAAGEVVRLRPIGTNLIGAKGRVDMSGKSGSVKIVLVDSRMKGVSDYIKITVHEDSEPLKDIHQHEETNVTWEWKFVTAPPTRKYQPVNEATIYSAIMELTNGE